MFLLVASGPSGELFLSRVVQGIVVLVGNIVGLYFYLVENWPWAVRSCPRITSPIENPRRILNSPFHILSSGLHILFSWNGLCDLKNLKEEIE